MLIPGKNHTNYPEKDDIISCHQHIRRIKIVQILCLFRPSQSGKGPERRGKPCVQGIRVLRKMGASTLKTALRRRFCNNDLTTFITVIRRYAVPPPELSGNTPVLDIICPVIISLVHSLWNQLDISTLNCLHSRFYQFIHLDKPLLFHKRLDRRLTAVMCAYIVAVILHLHQKPHSVKLLHNGFSRLIALHARIGTAIFIDGRIIVHNIDNRQSVPFANLKVIWVMTRRNLHNACSKFHIDIRILNDRNLTVHQRQHQLPSSQMRIPFILRVNGHCRISEHCLRSCRRKCQILPRRRTIFIEHWILDVPQMS